MEKRKVVNLEFASSLTEVCEVNSSFDSAVLRIAYAGRNRNKSYISRQAFEKCIESMYNCPIVCNYDRETDTLGGHDIEVVADKNDGSLRVVNATDPVGVIPMNAKWYWDTVTEEDGTEHEYLFANVLLWKRQEAYRKIKRDGFTSHSMEITVKDGELREDGYFHIYDFEFTAFCLIGVEPCFESSALIFSNHEIKQQIAEMMQDLKDSINSIVTPSGDNNIHPQKYSTEGGKEKLDEVMKLAAEYGIDIESLDFSVEDFTIEELVEKFKEIQEAMNIPTEEPEQPQDFALTHDMIEEICRSLEQETFTTEWGTQPRYWYIDSDLEAGEVYAWDCEDWLIYGFTYNVNGDAVEVNFDSKKRKKYAIVDFDEGEQASPIASVFENVNKAISDAISEKNEIEGKYNLASDALDAAEAELASLRDYKNQNEENILAEKRAAIFGKFEDLNDIEEFNLLKENCGDMPLDSIEEKCYALRGKYIVPAAKNLALDSGKAPKLPIQPYSVPEEEPYGGVVEELLGNR